MLFKCVTYQTDIKVILEKLQDKKICGILHDKDYNKLPHVHFIIDAKRQSPIQLHKKLTQLLGASTLCKTVFKFNEDFDYFTHKHNRSKFHYSPEEIFFTDEEYFKSLYTMSDYSIENNLIEDLKNPSLSITSLADIYGLDFVKNVRTYVYFRDMLRVDEERFIEEQRRQQILREQEERLKRERDREILSLINASPFPINEDDFSLLADGGEYVPHDYYGLFTWYRYFIRHETNNIPTKYFTMLPPSEQLRIENLAKKRIARGEQILTDVETIIPFDYIFGGKS